MKKRYVRESVRMQLAGERQTIYVCRVLQIKENRNRRREEKKRQREKMRKRESVKETRAIKRKIKKKGEVE